MKRFLALALILLNYGMWSSASGEVTDVSVTLRTVVDSDTRTSYLRVDPMTMAIPTGKHVAFSSVSFHAQVSPGQFLELWLDDGGGTLPWKRDPIDRSLRQGSWVVDERTGSMVRFDITSIVGKALRDKDSLPGLLIRLLPDDDGNPLSLVPAASSQSKLTYRLRRK